MIRCHKNLIILVGVFLLASTLLLSAGTAWAQPAPATAPPAVQSTQGSSVSGGLGYGTGFAGGLLATPSLLLWQALLLIVETLASAVLFIASFFLDNIFYYNVVFSPSNMPAVQEGWTVMRDLANSLFILIFMKKNHTNLKNFLRKRLDKSSES